MIKIKVPMWKLTREKNPISYEEMIRQIAKIVCEVLGFLDVEAADWQRRHEYWPVYDDVNALQLGSANNWWMHSTEKDGYIEVSIRCRTELPDSFQKSLKEIDRKSVV